MWYHKGVIMILTEGGNMTLKIRTEQGMTIKKLVKCSREAVSFLRYLSAQGVKCIGWEVMQDEAD